MKKEQLKKLEEYLWELTKQVNKIPGLPEFWINERVKDLADIFRPIKKKVKIKK
jgi:hypothetical protein